MCFIEGTKFICQKVCFGWNVRTVTWLCLYCLSSKQHMEDICVHLDCSFFSLAHILSYCQWTVGMNDFSTHRVKTIKHCLGFNYFSDCWIFIVLLSSLQRLEKYPYSCLWLTCMCIQFHNYLISKIKPGSHTAL